MLTAVAPRRPQIFSFLPDWVEDRGLNSVWVGSFVAVQSFGVVVSAAFGAKVVRKIGNTVALLISICFIVSDAPSVGAAIPVSRPEATQLARSFRQPIARDSSSVEIHFRGRAAAPCHGSHPTLS